MYTYEFLISPASNFIGIVLYKDKLTVSRDSTSINAFQSLDEAKSYLLDSVSSITGIDKSNYSALN
ncbi:MAG: hypothetical protein [Caudoviricetes sp.]|nr:MAG: hypothetical protein [Caudoviricetes sp.]